MNIQLGKMDQSSSNDYSSDECRGPLIKPQVHTSDCGSGLSPTIKVLDEGYPDANTLQLFEELRFFFMNPIEKWYSRRKFPYKFLLQVIKIVLITIQLYWFGEMRYRYTNYNSGNRLAFSHLFLSDWEPTREIKTYPPALGPLAVYQKTDFYRAVDFAFNAYVHLNDSIGPYYYDVGNDTDTKSEPNSSFVCFYIYDGRPQHPGHLIDPYAQKKECVDVPFSTINDKSFSFETFITLKRNQSLDFVTLVKMTLEFTVFVGNSRILDDCFMTTVIITFDNSLLNGQMSISLDAESDHSKCCHQDENECIAPVVVKKDGWWHRQEDYLLNYSVMCVCAMSMVLCARSIYRAQLLKKKTAIYFREWKHTELSTEGQLEFMNFWYIMIIANDILIIFGSYLQLLIARNQYTGDKWNICSLLLGTGNLLVWFGVLRYLGFFKTYNVVMLTLKSASPQVARFSLCAVLLYAGFVFCGWLVLGPYHMKFRSLSSTSDCLFSLINGDDMFATFSIIETKSQILWWYGKIYIYTFTSLFIYVILSLFIAVIMDSYETIKEYYKHGFPKSDVRMFIEQYSSYETQPRNLIDNRASQDSIFTLIVTFFYTFIPTRWRR